MHTHSSISHAAIEAASERYQQAGGLVTHCKPGQSGLTQEQRQEMGIELSPEFDSMDLIA